MPRGSYRPGASALLKNTVLSLPFLDLIRVRRQCRRKYPPAAAAHVYPFSLRWAAALACPFCLCQLRLLAGRARLPAPSPSAGSLSVSTGGACLPACSPRLATLALSSTTALRSRSPSATPLATKSTHRGKESRSGGTCCCSARWTAAAPSRTVDGGGGSRATAEGAAAAPPIRRLDSAASLPMQSLCAIQLGMPHLLAVRCRPSSQAARATAAAGLLLLGAVALPLLRCKPIWFPIPFSGFG
nr:unnamed protein product [Digitaria exilis]